MAATPEYVLPLTQAWKDWFDPWLTMMFSRLVDPDVEGLIA